LTVNAAGTGYDSTGATEYQTVVTDVAARYITVNSTGAKNSVDVSNNTAMTNLTITGSAALKASVAVAALTSLDGSAATGNLTLGTLNAATRTVKGGAGNDSATLAATATANVDTGAGNDTLTLGSAVAAGSTVALGDGNDKLLSSSGSVTAGFNSTSGIASTIDGGAGTDGVAVSLINSGNAARFVNFENLILDNTSGAFDTTLVSGVTGLEISSAAGGTYTGLNQSQSLSITNTANPTGTTTLTMTGVSGTADAYSITFSGAAATTVPTAATVLAGGVAVAGIENFTVVSGGGANTWNSLTLGADTSARTVTVSGAQNIDLAFAANFGEVSASNGTVGVSSIDASAVTGKVALNLTNVVKATAGLTASTGGLADTVTTGGVKVTLNLGAGNDAVVASGNTITVATAGSATETEAAAALVTFNDLAAGDTIDFSAGSTTAAALGSATSLASATTLLAALNALANAGGTGGGLEMNWGVYGGNTYVVLDAAASSTTAGLATSDVVIKIAGVKDLSASTVDTGAILTIV